MESEIENLQFEIQGALFQLSTEKLMQICDFLSISVPGTNRKALVANITQHVQRDEVHELED